MLSPVQQKCQREFSRFTRNEPPTKRLKEPDRRILDLLREEEFSIWLEDEEDDFDDRPGLDYLNEILHMYVGFSPQFVQELRKHKTSSEPRQKYQGRACRSSPGQYQAGDATSFKQSKRIRESKNFHVC